MAGFFLRISSSTFSDFDGSFSRVDFHAFLSLGEIAALAVMSVFNRSNWSFKALNFVGSHSELSFLCKSSVHFPFFLRSHRAEKKLDLASSRESKKSA